MTPPRKVSAAKASNDDVVLTRTGTALVVAVIVLVILVIAFVTLYTLQVLKTTGKGISITNSACFLLVGPKEFQNVFTRQNVGLKVSHSKPIPTVCTTTADFKSIRVVLPNI